MRVLRPVLLLTSTVLLGVVTLTGCDSSPTAATDPRPAAAATSPQGAGALPASIQAPQQGGTYGVVVLATGRPAALRASQASVETYGETASTGSVGCLAGAAQAFGLDEDMVVTDMLFADVADAQQFADAYTARAGVDVVGVAQVKAYCLD